jgi:hypothetical protein
MKQASIPFACAVVLVGCTAGGGKGTLTATWSLKNIDGSPAACMSGFDTMKVSALAWDASLDSVEPGVTPVVGLFDCAAGSGTLELPLDGVIDLATLNGKFDIQFDETDSTGDTSVATDMQSQIDRSSSIDASGGSASVAVTMYQDGGYAWLDWTLFGTSAQDYLDSCAGAGVDKIDVALTEITTMAVTQLSFPCATSDGSVTGAVGLPLDGQDVVGAGIAPVLAGDYNYTATAYAGATVVGTQEDVEDITVAPRNKIGIFADSAAITLTNR